MSYLNRFLVEEECQFECEGVFELDYSSTPPFMRDLEIKMREKHEKRIEAEFESGDTSTGWQSTTGWQSATDVNPELHIFISDFSLTNIQILITTNPFLFKNPMITFVGSETLECVQKEEYEKFYRGRGRIRYASNQITSYGRLFIFNVRKSIGDGIENFFQLMKMKMIAVYLKKTIKGPSSRVSKN